MRASYWLVGAGSALALSSMTACKVTIVDGGNGGSGSTTSASTTTKTSSSSGTGTTTTTVGTTTTTTTTTTASSTGSMGTGGMAGIGPFATPSCDAPATPPSNGACFTAGMDQCNPINGEPCMNGETCDYETSTTFVCYPGDNSGTLCGACDPNANVYCENGLECLATDQGSPMPTEFKCYKFCCTDADCGGASGSCNKDLGDGSSYGLCGTLTAP